MKWTRTELARWPYGRNSFEEKVAFVAEDFKKGDRLRDLKDVVIRGSAFYDRSKDHLYVDYQVDGIMTVEDNLTLEDVDIPFHAEDSETFSFVPLASEEDAMEVKGETVDILPQVYASIRAEIPWIVHKDEKPVYPKGEGWEVVSEADYQNREREVDPRLAKILEYKPTEEN